MVVTLDNKSGADEAQTKRAAARPPFLFGSS